MADIAKISVNGTEYDIKDQKAQQGVSELTEEIYTKEFVKKTLNMTGGTFYVMGSGISNGWVNAYASAPIPVRAGETLKVTARTSTNVCGIMYFSSATPGASSYVGFDLYDTNNTAVQYTDVECVVPQNATHAIIQGRNISGAVFGLEQQENKSKIDAEVERLNATNDLVEFEIKNIDRRLLKAEKGNDFAWAGFDAPYFVFIHDDSNDYLESYAGVFHAANVPMCAATIPAALTAEKIAVLRVMVEDGGEVLAHYSSSPTDATADDVWLQITRDTKRELEALGFDVRGIIKANQTASATYKGEKYLRRYYDYADNDLGRSTQYDLPRTLMLRYENLEAFKAQLLADSKVNGIHAYGFHGGRADEAWITTEAIADIISYITNELGCEIVTYSYLFDTYGSTVLAEKIKMLESGAN